MTAQTNHTISIYVTNKPGVLSRVSLVFARRGFNIDSLVVSPGQDGKYSRITITAQGNPENIDQINKQVAKLVDVLKVSEHSHESVIEKELALIKVRTNQKQRTEILQLIDHFSASTEDITTDSLSTMITGSTEKLDAFIEVLKPFEILEIVRTGKILMTRGDEPT
jgi:acetolactate synthase-1/3 small subunit